MPVRLVAHSAPQPFAYDLKDGVYRIGREAPADVVIPDKTISGNHAELQVTGNDWMIRDLGSTNGTFLDDAPVKSSVVKVRPGARLRFGAVNITLEAPPKQAAAVAAPTGPSAASVKVEAAKDVARKLQWNVRYWIAGAEAILFLVVLVLFVQIYSASSLADQASLNRYRIFAAQYVNVLTTPNITSVPPPVIDASLSDPLVADRDGNIVYPSGADKPPRSPIVRKKAKTVFAGAAAGLYEIPESANTDGVPYMSFPVRAGGEVVGYVLARQVEPALGGSSFPVLITVLAGIIALALLAFTLRPVNRAVREVLEGMRLKVVPYANGMVEELPRSPIFAEANALSDEVEKGIRLVASASSHEAGGRADSSAAEKMAVVAELVNAARLPWCAVDGDFRILFMSPGFPQFAEFARAREGVSLFDAGLTNIQAKQLVQVIGDARRQGFAEGRLSLTGQGVAGDWNVSIRTFPRRGDPNALTGLLFTPPA